MTAIMRAASKRIRNPLISFKPQRPRGFLARDSVSTLLAQPAGHSCGTVEKRPRAEKALWGPQRARTLLALLILGRLSDQMAACRLDEWQLQWRRRPRWSVVSRSSGRLSEQPEHLP